MNFEEVYKLYKIYVSKLHKKQALNSLLYNFEYRVLPYFKNYNIYEITKNDILRWKDIILGFNYSNSFNANIYYAFNNFLEYCVLYHNLEHNYLKELGGFKSKIEIKKTDFYTFYEFKKFIKCFDNLIYKSYYIIMFYTGLRPSEAMALKFNDFDGKYLKIDKSIQRRGNRELDTPKNIYSIRKIIVNNNVKKCIKLLKKYYIRLYHSFDDDYFILGGLKPLSATSCDRYKKNACQRANLRCITQHQFRHSYATYLTSRGIPINVVSHLLGHSNVFVTSKIYIHQDFNQEKRVLRTLNSVNLFK
uniref:Recombinase n=1 Tax=Dulem virus 71 TaxID=3145782 RepID=A0AAU8AYM1_9VIRU